MVWCNLAVALDRRDAPPAAILEAADKALELARQPDPDVVLVRGLALAALDRPGPAADELERALTLDPRRRDADTLRAMAQRLRARAARR